MALRAGARVFAQILEGVVDFLDICASLICAPSLLSKCSNGFQIFASSFGERV